MAKTVNNNAMLGLLLVGLGLGGIGGLMVVPEISAMTTNQQKIEHLDTEVKALEAQQASLNQNIQRYEQENRIPKDLIIRTYEEATKAQVLKEMLDKIVGIASNSGNVFISLEPYETGDPVPAAPAATAPTNGTATTANATPAANGTATPAAAPGTPEAAPAAPPQPQLMTYGYTMALRGSYDDVLRFLGSLNSHNELIEVSSIKVENEAGPQRQGSSSANAELLDPTKPIKLTAKVKLILLPKSTA
jgi:outer membrane murein-binding lipoprotein Lpp